MPPRLLLAGKVNSTHGVRGLVKIYSYLENPDNFGIYNFYKADGSKVILKLHFTKKNQAICEFDGVSTKEQAEQLAGLEIYINRNELPEIKDSEFYHSDLIGLKVIDSNDKTNLGTVIAIHNFGAGDIIEIKNTEGKSEMISFTDKIFPYIDIEHGRVEANLPKIELDNKADEL